MGWTRIKRLGFAAGMLAASAAFVPQAQAACPASMSARVGDTAQSIARACGLNVEALKSVNPGIRGNETIPPGTTVRIPRVAVPSPMLDIGRPLIRVNPPLVPNVPDPGGSTVILPPEQPPVPPQLILPGLPLQPGQLPPFGTSPSFN